MESDGDLQNSLSGVVIELPATLYTCIKMKHRLYEISIQFSFLVKFTVESCDCYEKIAAGISLQQACLFPRIRMVHPESSTPRSLGKVPHRPL